MGPAPLLPVRSAQSFVPTTVIRLAYMTTREELVDDDEVHDLRLDVEEECTKYGGVVSVHIPRPAADPANDPPGVGLIFVQFDNVFSSAGAIRALHGRLFNGNHVNATFYSEEKLTSKAFE